jgi:threonine/homoserine/homoserine lactone efflux protein
VGITDLWLFILAGLLLNATPGPDMALIVARSAQHGVRAGVAAALGVAAGCFVHITAAALGLSAMLLTSATLFTLLKWLGAAYLIYLGARMLRGSFQPGDDGPNAAGDAPASLPAIFLQGLLTNALNPKVAVFFLAFLPQFIAADAPSKVLTFFLLGLLFNANSTLFNVGVAWAAGRASSSPAFGGVRAWLQRTIGALFIGLGARLALADRG